MVRVEKLMTTGVIAVRDTDTVGKADSEMRTADIRHLPVIDRDSHVVGIVSNRDLLRALGAKDGCFRRIGEVMTRDVATVHPQMPAHQAVEIMLERKIGALPVVGDDGVMIGIITETDFLGVAHQALSKTAAQAHRH